MRLLLLFLPILGIVQVLLNLEHRLMLHFAPDLDSLSLLQKVEVFKHALAHTSGMDLYRVLWMKVGPASPRPST